MLLSPGSQQALETASCSSVEVVFKHAANPFWEFDPAKVGGPTLLELSGGYTKISQNLI